MLKKFFISMLGTIAGFWISIIIAFFAIAGIIGALVASTADTKTEVKDESVLYLDLSGEIPERAQTADIWQLIQQEELGGEALDDILASIRLAAKDKKIKGIYINAQGASSGPASREEIVEALGQFRASGKWIYAYGDSYSQGDYLLATLADSIFLNPMGSVDVRGVATQTPFFTGLLDKLGVKMNIVRVGTFKSAVEPYFAKEMSPASRLQTQVMIDSIWGYITSTMASARQLPQSTFNGWADSIMATWTSQQTLDARAVTSLKYRRQAEAALRAALELDDDDDLPLVSPSEYMSARKSPSSDKDHIAVYYAVGDIVDSGEGGIVGDVVVDDIISLADDNHVKAMLLRVNSPGGSAFASEQIWEALQYFKSKGKPLYVSMGDYAASGGYYISCGADRIFADHTTLTGSIGVFGLIPDFSGLATDKLGVTFATVQTNPNAAFPSTLTGLTSQQLQALQRSVEQTYDQFTSRVATGRGLSQDSVKAIAEGRVWTGGAALQLGLVDEIGSLQTALTALAEATDLEADKAVSYPDTEQELIDKLMLKVGKNVQLGSVSLDRRAILTLSFLDRLQRQNPIQARIQPISFE